ncbi:glycosyltransferase family 4 protein [Robbsia andropogonis]|uniref:glycosyltransferase family 4 protein n=1 Tax=Robbsia andropogonis TaxID=28092 RepID=UPI002A69C0F3|nr:glycosyltransferase family 4 protein [Robbsia andropogonis]
MKRLVFIPSLGYGGCEEFAAQLLALLDAASEPAMSCMPAMPETAEFRQRIARIGKYPSEPFDWHCGCSAAPNWPSNADQYSEAMSLLGRLSPKQAIVVLPDPTAAFGFLAACIDRGIPSVVIFQLCDAPFRAPAALRRRAAALKLVSVSAAARKWIASAFGVASECVKILPNVSRRGAVYGTRQLPRAGVPLLDVDAGSGAVVPPPKDPPMPVAEKQADARSASHCVLTVARITRQNGWALYPRIVMWVKERTPDVQFVWVGDGEDKNAWRAALVRSGLAACVTLAGQQSHVGDWYRCADLLLLPSIWEGTPLSLSEAMQCGCPIVTTRVGGIPEMLDDTQAWLVSTDCTGDLRSDSVRGSVERLGAAIVDALNDPAERALRANAARARWSTAHENGLASFASLLDIPISTLCVADELLNRQDR